jgi:zinc transporter
MTTAGDSVSYAPTGLLHALVLDGAGGATSIDWAGIDRWQPADGVLWLSLDYSAPDAARWLAGPAKLDPVVHDALLDTDPRPRALAHDDSLLMIVRGINLNRGAEPEDMISVRSWIEPRRIITLRHRASRSLSSIAGDLERGAGPRDAGAFVATFIDRILELVVTRVDVLGDAVAHCEDMLLGDPREQRDRAGELRAKIADQRRRAIALRRFLAPQREALGQLATATVPWLSAADRARIAEAGDRQTRTVEELDAARDRAAVTQEELSSRTAEQTNQRLYTLSIITAVFLPIGFVTGLLGVNVGGVPFQDVSWAFWGLCGAFGIGVAFQLWLFRRRGWL